MSYIVDPLDPASPLDSDFPAALVASELRQLKARINTLETTLTNNMLPIGAIVALAHTPASNAIYHELPAAPSTVARVGSFADLFAAIGTTWGAGDGTTTFGLPWVAEGDTIVRGTPGTDTSGVMPAHTHGYEDAMGVDRYAGSYNASENLAREAVAAGPDHWEFGAVMHRRSLDTDSAGTGTKNKASGSKVRFYIKIK